MLITDIKRVIEQVSRDKGIEFNVLIKALEEALRSAARKKFGNKIDIEIQYNEESGELEVFQFKEVVEAVEEPAFQISLEEGRKLDPECEIGDSLGTRMDTTTFGRIAAQSAKQVIIQKMKVAERSSVYHSFADRKGEIVNGIIQRVTRNEIIVNLGSAEALLSKKEQIPGEIYRRGDRIRAYVLKVHEESRGPQIELSRTHPGFLMALFKTEVPEINEGIVKIVAAAREAGSRGKIAVMSTDPDIDPVGACVGIKGNRVQSVVQELRNEKIDIIPWNIDLAKFVCNALAPADISKVIIDDNNHSMEVVVPDDSLAIAIGRNGQNVRLASRLTGWRLDVFSESRYNESIKKGYDSLMNLPDMTEKLADTLIKSGYFSAEDLARTTAEELAETARIPEAAAEGFIASAEKALSRLAAEPDKAAAPDAEAEPDASAELAEAEPDASAEPDAEAEDQVNPKIRMRQQNRTRRQKDRMRQQNRTRRQKDRVSQ
jgi:transcription termination/antitermination protein NusA